MNWVALVSAGFFATTLALVFFALARSVGLTKLDPTADVGGLVTRDRDHPLSDTVGMAVSFLVGSVPLPALLTTLLSGWTGPAAAGGAIAGGFLGLLVGFALSVAGMIRAQPRFGAPRVPGPFGIGWGKATPGVIVAGCMLYGAVAAAVLAGF